MRRGVLITIWLILCAVVAAAAWYQGRPRQHVANGGTLRAGETSGRDASAYIIEHHAVVQGVGQFMEFRATVKDISGATIRLELANYPDAARTTTLSGPTSSVGTTSRGWRVSEISRAEMLACMLGARVPEYTLTYTTPRSRAWSYVSVVALISGPLLPGAILLAGVMLRRLRAIPRGFEIISRRR